MLRPIGLSLLTLPIAAVLSAVLAAGSAQAQSQTVAQTPAYSAPARQDAAHSGLFGLFQTEAQAQPADDPNRIDSQALPPPGFAAPYGVAPQNNSPVGHQFGAQPPVAGPAPVASEDPNALRPPGVIGAAPAAAPQGQAQPNTVMTLPPEDQPEQGQPKELPANLKKQLVDYASREPAGTLVVDTAHTYLYLVLGGGKALRYGIGVGREGFTWAGTERISRMKEWPDWFPPPEMIDRQPYLPRMMAGGPGNPLGARALYLGKTLYRIHGTNQPSTIGSYVSSGCIRLLNEDIEDLYSRVQVGSRVVVLPGKAPETVANNGAPPPPANPMAPPGAAAVVTGGPTNIAPVVAQPAVTGQVMPQRH
jgi:lipoprotein-anchoring transpeptidase ErfK/SrfK